MPRFLPDFLQRIKDQIPERVKERIKRELAPTTPDEAPPEAEDVSPSFGQRIKQTIKDKFTNLAPVQRRMLDPSARLDLPTLKYRARYAGQNNLLVLATYNGQPRHIEVYSWRMNGKGPNGTKALRLFAYCRIHDRIHCFVPEKFTGFIVTDEPYNARWPIEVS